MYIVVWRMRRKLFEPYQGSGICQWMCQLPLCEDRFRREDWITLQKSATELSMCLLSRCFSTSFDSAKSTHIIWRAKTRKACSAETAARRSWTIATAMLSSVGSVTRNIFVTCVVWQNMFCSRLCLRTIKDCAILRLTFF